AMRQRVESIIIEDQLDPSERNSVIEGHAAVAVPTFDRAGEDYGEIHFAEFLKDRIRSAHHAHDLTALVGYLQKRYDLNPVDHSDGTFSGASQNRAVLRMAAKRLMFFPACIPHFAIPGTVV